MSTITAARRTTTLRRLRRRTVNRIRDQEDVLSDFKLDSRPNAELSKNRKRASVLTQKLPEVCEQLRSTPKYCKPIR